MIGDVVDSVTGVAVGGGVIGIDVIGVTSVMGESFEQLVTHADSYWG